jgi:hypothetical protein
MQIEKSVRTSRDIFIDYYGWYEPIVNADSQITALLSSFWQFVDDYKGNDDAIEIKQAIDRGFFWLKTAEGRKYQLKGTPISSEEFGHIVKLDDFAYTISSNFDITSPYNDINELKVLIKNSPIQRDLFFEDNRELNVKNSYSIMWSFFDNSPSSIKLIFSTDIELTKLPKRLGLCNININDEYIGFIHQASNKKFRPTAFDAGLYCEHFQLGGITKSLIDNHSGLNESVHEPIVLSDMDNSSIKIFKCIK